MNSFRDNPDGPENQAATKQHEREVFALKQQVADEGVMCYIGRKKHCGCIVAASVDTDEHTHDVAEDVAEFIRSGLTVERVSLETFRAYKFGCDHGKPGHDRPEAPELQFTENQKPA